MPNKNYQAGRRLEYESINRWKERGYAALRTAGSHGEFDVVAYRMDRKPEFIQCKRVTTETQLKSLIKSFKVNTIPSSFYNQVLEVKIKGQKEITSVTI